MLLIITVVKLVLHWSGSIMDLFIGARGALTKVRMFKAPFYRTIAVTGGSVTLETIALVGTCCSYGKGCGVDGKHGSGAGGSVWSANIFSRCSSAFMMLTPIWERDLIGELLYRANVRLHTVAMWRSAEGATGIASDVRNQPRVSVICSYVVKQTME